MAKFIQVVDKSTRAALIINVDHILSVREGSNNAGTEIILSSGDKVFSEHSADSIMNMLPK